MISIIASVSSEVCEVTLFVLLLIAMVYTWWAACDGFREAWLKRKMSTLAPLPYHYFEYFHMRYRYIHLSLAIILTLALISFLIYNIL